MRGHQGRRRWLRAVACLATAGVGFANAGPASGAAGPANTWATVASLHTAREYAAVVSDGGLVYAIGGRGTSADPPSPGPDLASVESYNPKTDTWTERAPLKTAATGLAAAVGQNGDIYVFGGYTGAGTTFTVLPTAERYDPKTNKWTDVADMPTPRAQAAAVTGTNGLIYVIGGEIKGGVPLATVQAYNPKTNKWATEHALLSPRKGLSAVTGPYGDIRAIGGETSSSGSPTTTTELYNVKSNKWSSGPQTGLSHFTGAAVTGPDGRIYALGGFPASSSAPVEAFDEAGNAWTTCTGVVGTQCQASFADMPTWRLGLGAAVGGDGRIYAVGGYQGLSPLSTVGAYTPYPWLQMPSLGRAEGNDAAASSPDGVIYEVGGCERCTITGTNHTLGQDHTLQSFNAKQGGAWKSLPPMPTARDYLAAAVGNNGLLYAMGGASCPTGTCHTNIAATIVEAYNPQTRKWICSQGDRAAGCASRSLKPMPVPRSGFSAVTLDGLIYVLGSGVENSHGDCDASPALDVYNARTDTWMSRTRDPDQAPDRCETYLAAGANGKLYVFRNSSEVSVPSTAEVYSPKTNAWRPTARWPCGAGGGCGVIGAAGLADGQISVVLDGTYADTYEPATNSWVPGTAPAFYGPSDSPQLSVGDDNVVAGPGERVYIVGGLSMANEPLSDVEAFTP